MQNELDILEQKLAQLITVMQQLRGENSQLRQELAAALSDNRLCQDRVEQAATRLALLLSQIPENAA
jgi:regulator of replication initiation timing